MRTELRVRSWESRRGHPSCSPSGDNSCRMGGSRAHRSGDEDQRHLHQLRGRAAARHIVGCGSLNAGALRSVTLPGWRKAGECGTLGERRQPMTSCRVRPEGAGRRERP